MPDRLPTLVTPTSVKLCARIINRVLLVEKWSVAQSFFFYNLVFGHCGLERPKATELGRSYMACTWPILFFTIRVMCVMYMAYLRSVRL